MMNQYLNDKETQILVDLVASVSPRVMIEFGCNLGLTARSILAKVSTLQRYIGIDVDFDHVTTLRCQQSEVPMRPASYVHDSRFKLILQDSRSLQPIDLEPCDAVFIDGDHSERAVLHDSLLAHQLLKPGGIIIWHDYQNPHVEVTGALQDLCCRGWPIQTVINTWLAYYKKEEK